MQRLDQLDARRSLAPMLVAGAVLISLVGLLGHTSIEAASKGRQGPRALVHDGLLENRRDSSSSSGSSTVVYVADLKVEDSLVGWGDLGLNSELGYEGLKLVHNVSAGCCSSSLSLPITTSSTTLYLRFESCSCISFIYYSSIVYIDIVCTRQVPISGRCCPSIPFSC